MADHAAAADDHAHSPEEFKKHLRGYWVVFLALLALTGITVAIATVGYNLHWSLFTVVTVALLVATTKGTLVALYFMHLLDEKKLIYWTLLLVALLAIPLFALPNLTDHETFDHKDPTRMLPMPGLEEHHEPAEGAKSE